MLVVNITKKQIPTLFDGIKYTFVGLTYKSKDNNIKKGGRSGIPLFSEATGKESSDFTKINRQLLMVGHETKYCNLVKSRANKTTENNVVDVETKKATWGQFVTPVLYSHNSTGEQYLTCFAYKKAKVQYLYKGQPYKMNKVEKSYVSGYNYIPSTQSEIGIDMQDKVQCLRISLNNIKELRLNKTIYKVVDSE